MESRNSAVLLALVSGALTLASSCTVIRPYEANDRKTGGRTIASAGGAADSIVLTTQEEQELAASQDLEKELRYRIQLIADGYVIADQHVKEFDRLVDRFASGSEEDPLQSDTYARLLALKEMYFQSRREVKILYNGLLERSSGQGVSTAKALASREALRHFLSSLQSGDEVDLSATANVVLDLQDASREFLDRSKEKGAVVPEDIRELVGPKAFIRRMGSDQNVRRALDARAKTLDLKLHPLVQRMNDAYPVIHEALRDRAVRTPEGRVPQSDAVYPDAGPRGNLTGNNFPENTWAITFDDGPSSKFTPLMLDALDRHGMKGNFFMLARNVKAFPELARQVHKRGMLVANHSFTHAQLTKLDVSGLRQEIVEAGHVIEEVVGEKPRFFRCPYGAGTNVARVRKVIADEGMIHVFWNVDTLDWQDKNPQSILRRTIKQVQGNKHGVILFHDIHPQSVEAAGLVMDYLVKQKSRVATLSAIVDEIK